MEIALLGSLEEFSCICELGTKVTNGVATRGWYTKRGLEYTSIDWNGLDGALPLDLQKPIDLGPFDILTNFGTTEHVENQEACWRNVHNLTKKVSVHLTPIGPHWEKHEGIYWLTPMEFYSEFAELNGYEVEALRVSQWRSGSNRLITEARLRKVKNLPFSMPSVKMEKV